MVAQSGQEAVNNADRYYSSVPGMCLQYVRTWLEVPSGSWSAQDGWNDAQHRHPEDKKPPKGAPCFYRGGSRGYGHITLSRGNGMVRSTDTPLTGRIGNVDLLWFQSHWSQDYLGWTEDLNGIWIPYLKNSKGETKNTKYDHGDVLVDKLHQGQKNSDSVGRLCYRLMHHKKMPDSHRPLKMTDNYNTDLQEAVRYWQRNINGSGKHSDPAPGPTDGSPVSNQQANRLFGDSYHVVEK